MKQKKVIGKENFLNLTQDGFESMNSTLIIKIIKFIF